MAAYLTLDYPCQDDAATPTIDDVSAENADGFMAGSPGPNTEDRSVAGPGGDYPKAIDCISSGPDYIYAGFAPGIVWSTGGAISWVCKRDNDTNTDQIAGAGTTDGSKIWFTGDGKIKLLDNDGDTGPNEFEADLTGINTEEWHAYAIIEISDELWLYVDGEPQDEFNGIPTGIYGNSFGAFGHDDGTLYSDMHLCGIRVRNGDAVLVSEIQADAAKAGLFDAGGYYPAGSALSSAQSPHGSSVLSPLSTLPITLYIDP